MFRLDTYTLASVTESSPGTIELRCSAPAEGSGGLHWTISRDHANDLARWWSTEDIRVKSGERPIRDKQCGNVLVSMFTPSMIHVRVRDRFGKINVVGYSFPRAVLEHLGRWFSQPRHDSRSCSQREDAGC
jgi:hypothetical protein